MFDTVRASIVRELDQAFLEEFATLEERRLPSGQINRRWFFNSTEDLFRMTYHEGDERVVVEVSLPRLVAGSNAVLLVDSGPALSRWDELIGKYLPGMPSVADWGASRVDCCWEFQTGDNVPAYISAMLSLDLARHKTVTWFGQSVEWFSKSHSFGFYSKEKQLLDAYGDGRLAERAKGLLRAETRLEGAKSIQTVLRLKRGATLSAALQPGYAYAVLQRDLARVRVDMEIPAREALLDLLVDKFGVKGAGNVLGFILLLNRFKGRNNLIANGYPKSNFYHYVGKLRDAGISPTVLDPETGQVDVECESLAPLCLPGLNEILGLAGSDGMIEPEFIPALGEV